MPLELTRVPLMVCFFNIANLMVQILIALGTVGALFAALHQIKKNKEQFDVEYKEKEDLINRAQANNVAAWFDKDRLPACDMSDVVHWCPREAIIVNENTLPIYNVIVSVVTLYGAGPSVNGEDNDGDYPCRLLFHEIVPGTWGAMIKTHGSGMGLVTTLEIAFTDSLGQSWIRRGNGILKKIENSPLEYYKIPLPASWSTPIRVKE